MSNNYIYTDGEKEQQSLSVSDLVHLSITHWRWFIVSFVVIMSLAVLKILSTEPTYVREATIMIKEESPSSMGNLAAAFGNLSGLTGSSDVNNELVAINSPAVMLQVIKDLDLNTSYNKIGIFRNTTLYGKNLPFLMHFPDANPDMSIDVKGTLAPDGKMVITKIKLKIARTKETFDEHYNLSIHDATTLETPVGKIEVMPNPGFVLKPGEEMFKGKTVKFSVEWRSPDSQIERWSKKLKAEIPNRYTSAIELEVNDVSAQRACDLINTVIKVYNQYWMDDKNLMTDATAEFVDQRLVVIHDELMNVDREIAAFKSENAMPDIQTTIMADMNKLTDVDKRILELNSQLAIAENIIEYIADPSNNDKMLPTFSVLGVGSNAVDSEINEYNKLVMDRNRLATGSTVNNPLIQDYDSRLSSMRKAISESVASQASSIKASLANMMSARQRTNDRISNAPTQTNDLLGIERQQSVKEALYLYLLQRKEENDLSRTFTPYNMRMITPPMGPSQPYAPRPKQILFFAFILSMACPVGLLFLREYLDNTVRTRADIDNSTSIPFLGSIPFNGKFKKNLIKIFKKKGEDEVSDIVVEHGNGNPVNEAFRMVRSNLDLMNSRLPGHKDGTGVVTMITSAIPGSGKTFVSLNLAVAFTLKKKRVVLVDMDLRKATLSKLVNSPMRGVASYLAGKSTLDQIIVKNVGGNEYLDVIPVGPIPPNPSELLDSPELKQLIDELRERYDVVFLDSAPTEPVTDSQLIAPYIDRTVYVIRCGLLKKVFLPILDQYYQEKKFNNIAIILNATDQGSTGSSGYGYGYGYGYGQNK